MSLHLYKRSGLTIASGERLRVGRGAARSKVLCEEGSALVEYAFTLIVLMITLVGIMDFGRALYTYHFLSNAAREATRWAAVNGSTCSNDSSCNGTGNMNNGPASGSDVQSYVKNHAPSGIIPTSLTINPSWPGNGTTACSSTPNSPGCPVEVEVAYRFNFLAPIVSSTSMTLTSTSEMLIAH
jgi:Flp pilus assembly protein TadG